MNATKIEWADATINPVVGCSKCSPGCDNCYAERMAARLAKIPATAAKYAGVVDDKGKWTGVIDFDVSCLTKLPKMPKRIFVGSMCDLFHDSVMDSHLDHIMGHISLTRANAHHTFMFLTKRAERMREFFTHWKAYREIANLWLGVTVCGPDELHKLESLQLTPAVKRYVSFEPLLSDLGPVNFDGIDWVICGGETAPNARPMHPDWVRSLRDQCQKAGVPFFFKGWGEWITIEDQARGSVYEDDVPHMLRSSGIASHHLRKKNGYLLNGTKGWYEFDPSFTIGRACPVGKKRAGRLLDGVEYSEFPDTDLRREMER
ncbi:MAG: phage Gp37/Gp68 family protein [Deltaproteobacteria bacterium]|jgi:protein gp37|nr:phage Gp37/Gp68 family protein [Deltaproteobacteria bacterium]